MVLTLILLINCTLIIAKNIGPTSNLKFKTILNAPVRRIGLSQLKGKIVIIEFWATWCAPCIDAMSHLKQLQKKYPHKLQIIAVTDETVSRTMQYLRFQPSNLWFAIDTDRAIANIFPHRIIPHTVLIGRDGKLIANTSPELISGRIIDSLWNKRHVHIPQKKDNLSGPEELVKQYFFAQDTVKNRFIMQTEIKGALTVSTTHFSDSIFNGRRLFCVNLSIQTLYNIAFGGFSSNRIIDCSKKSINEPSYCLDLIVENKADLLPTLQKELLNRFDLKAKIESKLKDVYVLTVTDLGKLRRIPLNTSNIRTYNSSHGKIDQQAITMDEFADYLENYGVRNLSVVNETNQHDKFDIKFSFQPEDPASLTRVLDNLGLGLKKEQREINFLLLYNP